MEGRKGRAVQGLPVAVRDRPSMLLTFSLLSLLVALLGRRLYHCGLLAPGSASLT